MAPNIVTVMQALDALEDAAHAAVMAIGDQTKKGGGVVEYDRTQKDSMTAEAKRRAPSIRTLADTLATELEK